MGISVIKVGLFAGAFILSLLTEVSTVCLFGKQYWSSTTGTCVECTRCRNRNQEVVIRPCHIYTDTICGPISALKLEWPGHKKHDHHHKHQEEEEENVEAPTPKHHMDSHVHHHHHTHDITIHDSPLHNVNKNTLKIVKEWERLLLQSKEQVQQRKKTLMKSLLEKKNAAKHHSKDWEDDDLDDRISEHLQTHEFPTHRPHISKFDLELLDKLVHSETNNRNKRPLEPLNLVDDPLREIHHKHLLQKDELMKDDFSDVLDFMAVLPTHRLFLGEPSTVPELISDQNVQPLEQRISSERLPFTAVETFVWDWQAVALISAVVACLLFFALAAVYSILHARQWRRIKDHFIVDIEELASRVSLMQNGGLNTASASDVTNSNHYLEQLIAEKKLSGNKSNIYIEKQPS